MGGPLRSRAALAGAGVASLVIGGGLLWWWWTRPPQIGSDEDVTKAVDALFTAVTARDKDLLGQCERRLGGQRDAGKLPADASAYLDGIISTARQGRWDVAAERLYEFVRAQRRGLHPNRPGKSKRTGN